MQKKASCRPTILTITIMLCRYSQIHIQCILVVLDVYFFKERILQCLHTYFGIYTYLIGCRPIRELSLYCACMYNGSSCVSRNSILYIDMFLLFLSVYFTAFCFALPSFLFICRYMARWFGSEFI